MNCVTLSNPNPIPPGESIDINELLEMKDAILDLAVVPNEGEINYDKLEYTPRMPVMEELEKTVDIPFLMAQSATDEEFSQIMRDIRKAQKPSIPLTGKALNPQPRAGFLSDKRARLPRQPEYKCNHSEIQPDITSSDLCDFTVGYRWPEDIKTLVTKKPQRLTVLTAAKCLS